MKNGDKLLKYLDDLKTEELLLPVFYKPNRVVMLDQTKLPEEKYIDLKNSAQVVEAISNMKVRGSGAIALAGIYGIFMAVLESGGDYKYVEKKKEELINTRPTAVNMHKTVKNICLDLKSIKKEKLVEEIENRCIGIMKKQLEVEKKIGLNGAAELEDGDRILTVCNAGAVAGFGFGGRTLSVFRTAFEQEKKIEVYAAETRPYLQGARITAWELKKFNIPVTLITDNMVGAVMQKGLIDKVITGSDRLAANGDTANKIGSYLMALSAKENNIPFFVSTSKYNIDLDTETGDGIEIEMRDGSEVLFYNGKRTAPKGVKAIYPAFDITPNKYISGIITEKGVLKKPYKEKLEVLSKLK